MYVEKRRDGEREGGREKDREELLEYFQSILNFLNHNTILYTTISI